MLPVSALSRELCGTPRQSLQRSSDCAFGPPSKETGDDYKDSHGKFHCVSFRLVSAQGLKSVFCLTVRNFVEQRHAVSLCPQNQPCQVPRKLSLQLRRVCCRRKNTAESIAGKLSTEFEPTVGRYGDLDATNHLSYRQYLADCGCHPRFCKQQRCLQAHWRGRCSNCSHLYLAIRHRRHDLRCRQ